PSGSTRGSPPKDKGQDSGSAPHPSHLPPRPRSESASPTTSNSLPDPHVLIVGHPTTPAASERARPSTSSRTALRSTTDGGGSDRLTLAGQTPLFLSATNPSRTSRTRSSQVASSKRTSPSCGLRRRNG